MSESSEQNEVKQSLSEVSERRVVGVANKIVAHARKLNGVEGGAPKWSEWSTGGVEPNTPIRLGDLRTEFPQLVGVLETPSGDIEERRDRIDDDTRVSTLGFWRNPDTNFSSIQFTLKKEGDAPRTIRHVDLKSGRDPKRLWENVGWKQQSKSYYEQQGESNNFLTALDQADKLTDRIVDSGNFNAYYATVEDKVGKADWEKR